MNITTMPPIQRPAPPARIAPTPGNPTDFLRALQQAGADQEIAPPLDDRRIQSLAQMVRMILAQTDRALLSMAPEMGGRLPDSRMGALAGLGGMMGKGGNVGWPPLPMAFRPPIPGLEESTATPPPSVVPLARTVAEVDGLTPLPAHDAPGSIQSLIRKASENYGVDEKLIASVVRTESDYNPRALSPVGAQGLMQLMPGTAKELGVTDPFDPEQNIMGGTRYLKRLLDRYNGDRNLALAAYNWGMGNLERNPNDMPSETKNYIAKVNRLMTAQG